MSGANETDNFSHRAGYHADPLAVAMKQARKGGTLAAGEGALLVAEIDRLTATVDRVRALHKPLLTLNSHISCDECYPNDFPTYRYPCATLQALNGDA